MLMLMCSRARKGGEEPSTKPDPGMGLADDDLPATFLPSAAELGLSLPEDKPNFRKCVSAFVHLFSTTSPESVIPCAVQSPHLGAVHIFQL